MKKFIYSLVLIFCLLPLFAISQPGSWKLIGKAGEWKNTITCVGLADKFYTIENSGALYSSDIAGNWTQIGKEDFINTKYFAAAGQKLYTIEKDGSLFEINSANGSWNLLGKKGDYASTIACAGCNGKLFTIETGGAMYVTNPDGSWDQDGKNDFANTKYFTATEKKLYTIEKDGSLFEINSANGSWKLLGTKGEYINTIACVGLNGKIYSIDNAGALYVTYNDGSWEQIGKNDFVNTRRIIAVGKNLVSLEKDGSLYLINVE